MFWILSLISYFIPLSTEYLLKTHYINPLKDRIYIQGIPVTPDKYLRFWNFTEIKEDNGKIFFSFIEDSLKSPEVLLYSIRGDGSSEIGGFLKTPIGRIENQSALLYSNAKKDDSTRSMFLLGFKHKGNLIFDLSYGQIDGERGYAISGFFKNFFATYAHGDFNEARAGFNTGKLSAYYKLDGKIHSAIFSYSGLYLGLSYLDKLFPCFGIEKTFTFGTLQVDYGANNFYNKLENRLYGKLKLEKRDYFAGIEGKIGKEGVFFLDNSELKGKPYIAGVFGGLQKEKLQFAFYYFLSGPTKFVLRASPYFDFKKGEVALEPRAIISYDYRYEKTSGTLEVSLFLFKAVEAKFSYDFSRGPYFGIGVNLFD